MRIHGSRAFVTAVLLTLSGIAAVAAQSVQPTVFEETGYFPADVLRESSGIAVSRTTPGLLWTHNDSGGRAMIYATTFEGAILAGFRVRGAEARDWEDIAVGPCPKDSGDGSCIYIADTGDNQRTRRHGVIYIVREPTLSNEIGDSEHQTDRAHELIVRYPDGPKDIEAIAVTPEGDILLATKGTGGPVVLYSVPRTKTDEGAARAILVDSLPILPARRFGNLVTAAAVSPSGQRLVVRTYTQLHFFAQSEGGSWQMQGQPCWLGLRQPQGEAVDFVDEHTVVLASEAAMGRPGGIARAVCPTGP